MIDGVVIRAERHGDEEAIERVTERAFAAARHRSGTEARIVAALRRDVVLALSLVAERHGEVVGHAAFSPVSLGAGRDGWFGLGPISVGPDVQGRGIGAALVEAGLARLRSGGARGIVLVGDAGYYRRFAFRSWPGLGYRGLDPAYVLGLPFGENAPAGEIVFPSAFDSA